jgi:hypothetical protein
LKGKKYQSLYLSSGSSSFFKAFRSFIENKLKELVNGVLVDRKVTIPKLLKFQYYQLIDCTFIIN